MPGRALSLRASGVASVCACRVPGECVPDLSRGAVRGLATAAVRGLAAGAVRGLAVPRWRGFGVLGVAMRGVGVLLLAIALVGGVSGCGRKATREDCEAVVDRNVELQLKALGVTDPAVVGKRRDEMRAAMREDIDSCVGKRVTDSMMKCVKSAETAEKIDKCLR